MNDLRAISHWLGREARLLLAAARAPGLWAALLAGLLLWALAYQAPAGHLLHIGGDAAARLRGHDAPFLRGVNDSEPDPPQGEWYAAEPPYRWTEERAEIVLPGMGGGAWLVHVRAASGRPDGSPVASAWQLGDSAPVTLTVTAAPRVYRLAGPAAGGDVRLRISAPPLVAPADPRTLGLVLYQASVAPLGGPPRAPHLLTLAALAATLAGAVVLGRRLACEPASPRGRQDAKARGTHSPLAPSRLRAFVFPSLLILTSAWMLVTRRADLAIFAPTLAALAWACYLLAALVSPLVAAAARALGVAARPTEREGAAVATVAAFGLRMGGMLHPYAIFSDTGLHLNNLLGVAFGSIFFTEGLPCEAGGGQSPYPPGPYLALAPGLLAAAGDARRRLWLLQGGVALAESLGALLVWLLLRRAGVGRRGALVGAILYAFAPPLLRSYAVGEMANLFGQALVLPLLLYLALGAARARWAALGAALLAAVLLSHTGVAISTAALMVAWLGLAAPRRRTIGRLLAAGAGAAAVALVLYYSAYAGLFAERRAQAQASLPAAQRCPPDRPLADRLRGWAVDPLTSPRPALPLPLLAAGAAGAALLLLPPPPTAPAPARGAGGRYGGRRALGLALAAYWLGAALSLGTLLVGDQAVRWQPFLFPALCLGAGAALAACGRRGRAGRWVALAALAFLCWYAAADWVRQVATYLH